MHVQTHLQHLSTLRGEDLQLRERECKSVCVHSSVAHEFSMPAVFSKLNKCVNSAGCVLL